MVMLYAEGVKKRFVMGARGEVLRKADSAEAAADGVRPTMIAAWGTWG